MKKLYTSLFLIVLVIAVSCNSSTKENTSSETENTNESKTENQFSEVLKQLQGTWKRIDYPYGTIEFEGNKVKFTTGEGAQNAAEFISFTIGKRCTASDAQESPTYDFALKTVEGNCDGITLEGNNLILYISGRNSKIQYERITES